MMHRSSESPKPETPTTATLKHVRTETHEHCNAKTLKYWSSEALKHRNTGLKHQHTALKNTRTPKH